MWEYCLEGSFNCDLVILTTNQLFRFSRENPKQVEWLRVKFEAESLDSPYFPRVHNP